MRTVIPNGNKVLVKPVDKDGMSKGGIILPEHTQEEKAEGIIIAVGTGKMADNGETIPLQFEVGQTILYGKYAGDEVTIEGKPYRIIRDVEILATVVESEQGVSIDG